MGHRGGGVCLALVSPAAPSCHPPGHRHLALGRWTNGWGHLSSAGWGWGRWTQKDEEDAGGWRLVGGQGWSPVNGGLELPARWRGQEGAGGWVWARVSPGRLSVSHR